MLPSKSSNAEYKKRNQEAAISGFANDHLPGFALCRNCRYHIFLDSNLRSNFFFRKLRSEPKIFYIKKHLKFKPVDEKMKKVFKKNFQGLCHDLGHGPFSHLFDGLFMKLANPESKWTHEKASIEMFDYLLAENPEVKRKLKEVGGLEDQDFTFIKELIYGPLDESRLGSGEAITKENWPYIGRGPEKSFLYQIISNKFSEVRKTFSLKIRVAK